MRTESVGRDAMGLLKDRGISPTHQRLEVLRYLLANPGHPSAEEVFAGLQGMEPPLSKASVYNILRLFEEKGLVNTLSIDARSLRYDLIIEGHGHFQCEGCGEIYNFTAAVDDSTFTGLDGFQVKHKDIYFRGLCPGCRGARTRPQDMKEENG